MSNVIISVTAEEKISVTHRPDLPPESGGVGFIYLGGADLLLRLSMRQLVELRDSITAAIDVAEARTANAGTETTAGHPV